MKNFRKITGRYLVVFTLLSISAARTGAAIPRGIILIPVGTVEVRTGANGDWHSVSRPTKIDPGQDVRTSGGSNAQIIFSDGSKVELSPNALFTVERTDTKETSFNLQLGKLKAYFSGIFSGRMKVRTPTAVASVRGTVFEISAAQGGNTGLDVHEGHVELQDTKGNNAVVGAEETVQVTSNGMEPPHLVSLTDGRAQPAARPMAVRMESAKDQTRHMIEELRNREMKANEAQLGKSSIDAFGHRVRIEEYILRPNANEFRFLFLSFRSNRFDWGRMVEQFQNPIPNDLTKIPGIVAGAFFSPTMPSNWMKSFEVYATNTTDAIKETVTFGAPVPINFSGFSQIVGTNVGTLYYPSSIDHQQILSGPGVPGGSRIQFEVTQDYNITLANQFVWRGWAVDATKAFSIDANHAFESWVLDPSNAANVLAGGINACGGNCLLPVPTTTASVPNGTGKADYLVKTTFADGSTVAAEKILVSNDGKIMDFANPGADTFTKQLGNFNVEEVVSCSMFQGRNIDVMVAPEIFAKTKTTTSTANNLNP